MYMHMNKPSEASLWIDVMDLGNGGKEKFLYKKIN